MNNYSIVFLIIIYHIVNTSTESAASSASSIVSTKPSSRDAVECVTTELKDMGVDKNKNIAVDGVKKLVSYAKDFRLGFMELRVCDDILFKFSS
jgi:hypothetical protein